MPFLNWWKVCKIFLTTTMTTTVCLASFRARTPPIMKKMTTTVGDYEIDGYKFE
jgi:hypothetical protein